MPTFGLWKKIPRSTALCHAWSKKNTWNNHHLSLSPSLFLESLSARTVLHLINCSHQECVWPLKKAIPFLLLLQCEGLAAKKSRHHWRSWKTSKDSWHPSPKPSVIAQGPPEENWPQALPQLPVPDSQALTGPSVLHPRPKMKRMLLA